MNRLENIIAFTIVTIFLVFGVSLARPNEEIQGREKGLEVHFLNVGQGDAILFEEDNHQVLVDGGPDRSVLGELGRYMPIGDKTIEVVILTHPHADHLRGLNYILESYEVEKVYFSGVSYNTPEFTLFMNLIKKHRVPTERLYIGKTLDYQGLSLKTLWPPEDLSGITDINDTSVVLDVEALQNHLLLLGDVSISAQARFRADLGRVDVLKVSHHGSKTGTDSKLLQVIKPSYAVIMVGKNSYGHPAPTILSLLQGSKILRTDREGTISFGLGKEGVLLY